MGFRTWLSDSISKKAMIVAFIHWYITFFLEKNFFVTSTLEKPFVAIAKLLVIFCFWQIAFYMVKRYKTEPEYRRYIHFAGAYFIFSMVVLLLIWPGNWVWDDLFVLKDTKYLSIFGWQHALTGFFYFIAIFICPSPVSVVILQLFIISLIVGFFVYVVNLLCKKSKFCLIAYIPFIFPTVLIHNFRPLRAALFAFLILYFITKIFQLYIQKKQLSFGLTLFISLIAALITTLRGEGFYFFILAPATFLFLLKHQLPLKLKITFLTFFICSVATILLIQKRTLNELDSARLKLTTYVAPLANLVNVAVKNNDNESLRKIDAILDTSQFLDTSGINAFWSKPLIKDGFNQKKNKTIFKTYLSLVAKYPTAFLSERKALYVQTKKEDPALGYFYLTPQRQDLYNILFTNDQLSSIKNESVRNLYLGKLLGLNGNKNMFRLFQNQTIPLLGLSILSLGLLIKKNMLYPIYVH